MSKTHHHVGDAIAEGGEAVAEFFTALKDSGDAKRVRLVTFSEFGRRVD